GGGRKLWFRRAAFHFLSTALGLYRRRTRFGSSLESCSRHICVALRYGGRRRSMAVRARMAFTGARNCGGPFLCRQSLSPCPHLLSQRIRGTTRKRFLSICSRRRTLSGAWAMVQIARSRSRIRSGLVIECAGCRCYDLFNSLDVGGRLRSGPFGSALSDWRGLNDCRSRSRSLLPRAGLV